MKNLEELKSKMMALPGRFAGQVSGADAIYPQSLDDGQGSASARHLTYENGFSIEYAKDPPTQSGRYIQRNEINRLGEIASRELHFREAGGLHTFSSSVSDAFKGYPERGVLFSYDGIHLRRVESTEPQNTKPFADNGIEIPDVVDCPVVKPEEVGTDAEPRVLWRSVSWINGIEGNAFRLEYDYTNIQLLKEGEPIAQDSLVVGTRHGWWGAMTENASSVKRGALRSHITITPPSGDDNILDDDFNNKGEFGMMYGIMAFPMMGLRFGKWIFYFIGVPYFQRTSGTCNFELHFFAKAGTTFSAKLSTEVSGIDGTNTPVQYGLGNANWFAIPIRTKIVEDSDD